MATRYRKKTLAEVVLITAGKDLDGASNCLNLHTRPHGTSTTPSRAVNLSDFGTTDIKIMC